MPASSDSPATVGPYRLLERLSAGRTGELFLAQNQASGESYVIRRLAQRVLRDPALARALFEQLERARRLNHPNICRVHQVLRQGAQVLVVMDHVAGVDLSRLLDQMRNTGPLSPVVATHVATQICTALDHAYRREPEPGQQRLFHGALWPPNVLIGLDGLVKVSDFGTWVVPSGLSSASEEHDPSMRTLLSYCSPEHISGEALSTASDIFCVGLLLYEMLTGRRPLAGSNLMDTIGLVEHASVERWDGIDPALLPVVQRCLQRAPRERYADVTTLFTELTGRVPLAEQGTARRELVRLLGSIRLGPQSGAVAITPLPAATTPGSGVGRVVTDDSDSERTVPKAAPAADDDEPTAVSGPSAGRALTALLAEGTDPAPPPLLSPEGDRDAPDEEPDTRTDPEAAPPLFSDQTDDLLVDDQAATRIDPHGMETDDANAPAMRLSPFDSAPEAAKPPPSTAAYPAHPLGGAPRPVPQPRGPRTRSESSPSFAAPDDNPTVDVRPRGARPRLAQITPTSGVNADAARREPLREGAPTASQQDAPAPGSGDAPTAAPGPQPADDAMLSALLSHGDGSSPQPRGGASGVTPAPALDVDAPGAQAPPARPGPRRFTWAHLVLLISIVVFVFSVGLLVRRLVLNARAHEHAAAATHDAGAATDATSSPARAADAAPRRRPDARIPVADATNQPPAGKHLGTLLHGVSKPGRLHVVTTPKAMVYVNGVSKGESPATLDLKPRRTVRLSLVAREHSMYQQRLRLPRERGLQVKVTLQPTSYPRAEGRRRGWLVVHCKRRDQRRILINGCDSGFSCPGPVTFRLVPGRLRLGFKSLVTGKVRSRRTRVRNGRKRHVWAPRGR